MRNSQYYHIESKKDENDKALESAEIQSHIDAFLADGGEVESIPNGIGQYSKKGNIHYRSSKAT